MIQVKNLISALASEVNTQTGQFPGVTRLVKLLYLLECWHYQLEKKRLTNLDWVYYHYGPYSFQLRDTLTKGGLVDDPEDFDSDKSIRRVRADWETEPNEGIPVPVVNCIKIIVRDWGHEDLPKLLDFVYFHTGPMREARRGEPLDMKKALDDLKRPTKVLFPRLDPALVKAFKKKNRIRRPEITGHLNFLLQNDPDLVKALNGMAKEETTEAENLGFVETPLKEFDE